MSTENVGGRAKQSTEQVLEFLYDKTSIRLDYVLTHSLTQAEWQILAQTKKKKLNNNNHENSGENVTTYTGESDVLIVVKGMNNP